MFELFQGPTDVTKETEIESMISQTLNKLGQIDILVNNSGVTMRKEPENLSGDEWDHVLNVNLRACFLASKTVYTQNARSGFRKDNKYRVYDIYLRWWWEMARHILPAKEE
ncbi:MAG: hypothetical protein CM1200mP15_07650 [Dehalococcoidia bacterium]|nr:MAG: hypothetical protein CM1200mP15_07650 [Dehalococcoidia bacterium]